MGSVRVLNSDMNRMLSGKMIRIKNSDGKANNAVEKKIEIRLQTAMSDKNGEGRREKHWVEKGKQKS